MSLPSAARAGLRGSFSVVIGYVPFALALGAALGSSGIDPLTAWLSSPLMIAGAAQLITVQMLATGAGVTVTIVTALVVNARHVLYSARMASLVPFWGRRDRWAAAYLLADPMFALAVARFRVDAPPEAQAAYRTYFFTAAWTCWAGWLLLTAAGVLLGDALPAALPLEAATGLTFLLLLLPTLEDTATKTAAVVGGSIAACTAGLPLGLGLLVAAAAGVAVGTWASGSHTSARSSRKDASHV